MVIFHCYVSLPEGTGKSEIVDLSSLWGRRWGMQVSPAHPVSGMLGASTMTTRFFFCGEFKG